MTDVALVHDYLTQRGGAERVVMEMTRAFPGAPVYTSLYEPATTFSDFEGVDVRASILNRSKILRDDHRRALPALAAGFSSLRIDAETVICSSTGWAHGVRTDGRKIVYCNNPARWLYQPEHYLVDVGRPARTALRLLDTPLRRWDRRSAATADLYIANSKNVQDRIKAAYGFDSVVLHPPATFPVDGPMEPLEDVSEQFLLCVARLLPYKNVESVIRSLDHMDDDTWLVVVGDGPQAVHLRRLAANRRVRFLGRVDDARLRWLYAHCSLLVAASYEDFGLTPIEAALFGKPTVALRGGGYLETIVEGITGLFFDEPSPEQIAREVSLAASIRWDVPAIRSQAQRFSPDRFRHEIRAIAQNG